MPIAYSYKRFSSDAQEGGDSIRRQTALAMGFVDAHPEHDLVLDQSLDLTDRGVSAFKGKNFETGSLGVFVAAVHNGLIPRGSWLLIESLDRLTRLSVNKAAGALLNLINAGIVVCTLHNETIYREESFDGAEGLVHLLGALIAMEGHHKEQVNKGKRIAAAWSSNYAKIGTAGHIVTKIVPFWLEVNAARDGFHVLPDKVSIVKEIFERKAAGEGKSLIAADLTERRIPTAKGRAAAVWHPSAVGKLLDSDAVVGTFTNSAGETWHNYYPSVIDQNLYQVVRALRQQSQPRGGSTTSHILTGLVKHACGVTMRRINKGEGLVYLRCPSCRVQIRYEKALDEIKGALYETQWVASTTQNGPKALQMHLDLMGYDMAIEDAFDAWKKEKTKSSKDVWARLENEKNKLSSELAALKSTNTEILCLMEEQSLIKAAENGNILEALRSVVKSISFNQDCTTLELVTISGKTSGNWPVKIS